MEGLIEKVKEKIIEHLCLEDVEPGDIDASAPLFGEGLGLDSIDALELVVMLEKDYKIKIENMDEGKKAFDSVRAMAEYIEEHLPA